MNVTVKEREGTGEKRLLVENSSASETSEIKNRIQNYWTERSESFASLRKKELAGEKAVLWMAEIEKYIPKHGPLRILDVGTGGGFFAIMLAKCGHQVTGIDLTPSMITQARKLAAEEGTDAEFLVMDAEQPQFEEESFDVVISRNLTWTLPHPALAYENWYKLLKKGGILLNFDADYGNAGFKDYKKLPEHHAHKQIKDSLLEECDAIKASLEISRFVRPIWDVHTLFDLGMEEIKIDTGLSKRVYAVEDELYNPTPMFALCAVK